MEYKHRNSDAKRMPEFKFYNNFRLWGFLHLSSAWQISTNKTGKKKVNASL